MNISGLYRAKLWIYVLGITVWEVYNVLSLTAISDPFQQNFLWIRWIGLCVVCVSTLLLANVHVDLLRQVIFLILASVVLYFNVFVNKEYIWVDIFIITLTSIGLNIDDVFRYFWKSSLIIYGAIVCSSIVGIIQNQITYGAGRTRNNFGFTWSTFNSHELLTILCMAVWCYGKKLNWLVLLIINVLNVFLFIKTDTKAPFILILVTSLCVIFLKIKDVKVTNNKLFKGIFSIAPTFLTVLMVFLSTNFDKFSWLNKLLSNRLYLGNQALIKYPINFKGNTLNFVSFNSLISSYFTIDSSFLRYLLNFGLISTTIVLFGMFLVLRKIYSTGSAFKILAVTIIIVNGFSDPWLLNLGYNPFILFLSTYLIEPMNYRKLGENKIENNSVSRYLQ
ncbi:hypothetical protein [Pediococcus acidilactici]|uniref:hypothetical protein n=1 Tax=Pediococcus acidilactici TaxID=1254 RepID=UPI001330108E|nr:hypothetical protein [Pediococcus acidilactici]KAF0488641.1 hypothetical protein GBP18_08905 [Pediococcus acidilactici]